MKKVITYGTFEIFNHGHLNLLNRAKKLGDCLIVCLITKHFDDTRCKLNVIFSNFDRLYYE